MRLSATQVQGNQLNTEINGKDADAVHRGLVKGMEEISSKTPGQTVTGEIVGKNGNDLLIAIGRDQLLRAKLEGNVQVEVGGQMSFAIKAMAGSKVVLSPLYANTAGDASALKALQMANIPATEVTVGMVKHMMSEGLAIDKNSLYGMLRTVNQFPAADMESMVQLTKMNIPVTEDSLLQMHAYKNNEHFLSQGILDVADSMTETMQMMNAGDNTLEGVYLFKDVLSLLSQNGGGLSEGELTALLENAGVSGNQNAGTSALSGSDFLAALKLLQGTAVAEDGNALLGEAAKGTTAEQSMGKRPDITITNPELLSTNEGADDLPVLSAMEKGEITASLKQAGFGSLVEAFSKNLITEEQLLSSLSKGLDANMPVSREQISALAKLFESETFGKLLKNEMKNNMLLTPPEVGENKKVEEFYEQLNRQMAKLTKLAEQHGAKDTPLAKTVNNVTGNIDFMNQLNQMYTYVQLPLKLQGQEGNGELYVYTNKKSLAEKEGEVSALLHLDMEHLGSVDVHVALKESKVATQFYLQDDSTLDLIEQNIGLLNKRLEKRGYSMNASFILKEGDKPVNMMDEILKKDRNISFVTGYSFDVRA
ncbi:MAG: flagellar hook-length control protein FliK [Lachnospiraceae bacterium]|nr:flagellar hook-length control protein FliK [Lachnospiraceae bacterium]